MDQSLGTEFLSLRSFPSGPRRKGIEGTEGIPGNSFEKESNCEGMLFDKSPILEGKEQGKERNEGTFNPKIPINPKCPSEC